MGPNKKESPQQQQLYFSIHVISSYSSYSSRTAGQLNTLTMTPKQDKRQRRRRWRRINPSSAKNNNLEFQPLIIISKSDIGWGGEEKKEDALVRHRVALCHSLCPSFSSYQTYWHPCKAISPAFGMLVQFISAK